MANHLHVKKDDTVVVISGKDKGMQGKVLVASRKDGKGRVTVENVNMVSRHTRPRTQGDVGGIIQAEAPIYASKVMLVCTECDKPTRVSYKIQDDGTKVRVCKKCGADIE